VYAKLFSFVTIAIFLFLSLFLLSPFLFAQDVDFILDSAAEYSFGQELRFFVNIENAAEVEKITLSLRPELSKNLYVIDVPFEQGDTISTTYKIDVKEIQLQPYSQVNYFLEIHTSDGLHKMPDEVLEYEDDRFVWQQMARDGVTAHWTGSGPFFGQDVLSVANDALTKLVNVLPLERMNPIDIYVYPSSADLRAGLRLAGQSGEATSPADLDVILVTAVNPQSALADLGQSLPYELTQLLLYRASGAKYEDIPWWLTEGLATSAQVQPHPRYTQLLDDAIRSRQTIPIDQLCLETERVGDRDLLASAQSNSLVNYLLQRYGEAAVVDLVTTYVQGDDCEIGVNRVFGTSLAELDKAWLEVQQPPSAVSTFFSAYGLWLILLLAGTAFMLLIVWLTWHGRNYE